MEFEIRADGSVAPSQGRSLPAFRPREATGRGGSGLLCVDEIAVEPTGVRWSARPLVCDAGDDPDPIPVVRWRTSDGSSIDLSPVMGADGPIRADALPDLLRTVNDVEALATRVPRRYRADLLRRLYVVDGTLMWQRTALVIEVRPRAVDARTRLVDVRVHENRNAPGADHLCFDPSELGVVDRWAADLRIAVAFGSAARAAGISDLAFADVPRPGRSPVLWVANALGLPLATLEPETLSRVAGLRRVPVLETLRPSRELVRETAEVADLLAAEHERFVEARESANHVADLEFDLTLFRVREFVRMAGETVPA